MKYDYLVVGAGLFGAVFAQRAVERGKTVLLVEKRNHIAGNAYTESIHGIQVHRYGAHIFHTNDREVWEYVNRFAVFNRYTNSPIANYRGEIYSLPFNMYTFNRIWGCVTPEEAEEMIRQQRKEIDHAPRNLEEQAISLVGRDLYEKLVKGYTEKQWGRRADELPAFIIRRLPVRLSYNNDYFDAAYQGIPTEGYTALVSRLLAGAEVCLGTDYLLHRDELSRMAERVVYTGSIDAYFEYCYGPLEYRTLHFEQEVRDVASFQGNAVVNYTGREVPWTRIVEHKYFYPELVKADRITAPTVITREYSREWIKGEEPYYPLNNEKNNLLYNRYKELAAREPKVLFAGRLGEYRYLDMDQVVRSALDASALTEQ